MKIVGTIVISIIGYLVWPHLQNLANQLVRELGHTISVEDRRRALNASYYKEQL